MKIKKYQGKSETEAILKVKEELGKEALILNIKTIKPRGFLRIFKANEIEVTAAIDEKNDNINKSNEAFKTNAREQQVTKSLDKKKKDITELEEKVSSLESLIERQMKNEFNGQQNHEQQEESPVLQLIYNQLIDNEVDEIIANEIINDISTNTNLEEDMDKVIAKVYKNIVKVLGAPKTIDVNDIKRPKILFFIGPTGVGKTTTVAKLASHFLLKNNKKIAFITSDTYRIAAVEQLRTYTNILCAPLKVIYSAEELEGAIDEFSDYDLILIDTAGRSHKNEEQYKDIKNLVQTIEEKEVFLVLSATTKYKDLIKIAERYSIVSEYNLIFTKLDETSCYGNILNIKHLTKAHLSYFTFGQNVPDDIGELDAQEVAKHLLGGNE
ncbi:MAG: flagellar biosynthesis protein FlhF [Eubacteriales bacterium]